MLRTLDVIVGQDHDDRDAWRVSVGVVHANGGSYDQLPIPFESRRDAEAVALVILRLGGPAFDAAEAERERRWAERTVAR